MKLKTVLAIMSALGKTIPDDIEYMKEDYGPDSVSGSRYYSDSKEEWIDILELDVIHAIRIIRKIGA
tara:strand:+ start:268 stop:468 length:201 start_codon:yes stop_codon:yes gene_type:complete